MRTILLFDLLKGFSRALDLVSPSLAGHHLRVALLSQLLAERMRLPHSTRKYMLMASMLHDIGAVPLKSDTSDLIFERNKDQHCRAGWAFCKTADLPKPVCEMVLHHHSEWCKLDKFAKNSLPANCIYMADRIDVALRTRANADLQSICDSLQAKCQEYAPACHAALKRMAEDAKITALLNDQRSMERYLSAAFSSVVLGPVQLVNLCGLFSQTIDSKSPFTATHSLGVAHTARMMLKLSRMADADDLTTMFVAGLLHDIGKLALPLEILEKPGPLTPEETLEIHKHAEISIDLLGSKPGFTCVKEWGGGHHERINGSGYPAKIAGSSLKLPVRIIAVADVFTALTEDRPYRAGMHLPQAMHIITSMAELGYLDKSVVALLADNVVRVNKERILAQRKAAANFVVMRRLCNAAPEAPEEA